MFFDFHSFPLKKTAPFRALQAKNFTVFMFFAIKFFEPKCRTISAIFIVSALLPNRGARFFHSFGTSAVADFGGVQGPNVPGTLGFGGVQCRGRFSAVENMF